MSELVNRAVIQRVGEKALKNKERLYMFNIRRTISALAIAFMLIPGAALANNDNKSDKDDGSAKIRSESNHKASPFRTVNLDRLLDDKANIKTKTGTIATLGTNSFTMLGSDGVTYTVNTSGATFNLPFKGTLTFSQIRVNDSAKVKGTLVGTTITAKSLVIVPANSQAAKASGTITAVSGNTVTLQTKGNNIVTVNTSGSTVTKADGTVGATTDVQVGTMVKVKGLWNSLTTTFNAIKIGIKAII